jgi:hypothetical protein
MTTRLFVMVSKKTQPRSYHSNGAACGLKVEMPTAALANSEAFVAQIRGHMELCELAVQEELKRLAAHDGTVKPAVTATVNGHEVDTRGAPGPPAATLTQLVEADPPVEDEADEDAPRDGRQLLGWARKQEHDMKGYIISLGYRRKFRGNVVDWTEAQVTEAYVAAKRELINPTPTKTR